MIRFNCLILAVLKIILSSSAFAGESSSPVSISAGLTYASEYTTDGFRLPGGAEVVEPDFRLGLPSLDLSFMYWSAIQLERQKSNDDEHDFFLIYHRTFLENSSYSFDFHGYYDYWFYPNSLPIQDAFGDTVSDVKFHGSKLNTGVSMLRLFPIAGSFLVPSYNVYYWIYWAQDRTDLYEGGAHHEFALRYSHGVGSLSLDLKEAYVGGAGSITYNDGAFGVSPGWNYSTASIFGGFKAYGADLLVSLNQQWSYQSTIDRTNDFWTEISLSKQF